MLLNGKLLKTKGLNYVSKLLLKLAVECSGVEFELFGATVGGLVLVCEGRGDIDEFKLGLLGIGFGGESGIE